MTQPKGLRCNHCQASTTNGLVMCDLCQMLAAKCLELFPIYFRNLARWRPGKAGSPAVPGSREPRRIGAEPDDRIGRALDEAATEITGWAEALSKNRPDTILPASNDETASVRVACWFLSEHLISIATLEWAGEMIRMLTIHEAKLRELTETAAPGWYAGACKICEAPTFVVPGLTWVTCRACGSTTYARDHLDIVLAEAHDWIAGPKAIAEAIVALVDTEQSVPKMRDRIRQWTHRERLVGILETNREYVWDDEQQDVVLADVTVGHPRYRFGDVLDLTLSRSRMDATVTPMTTRAAQVS